jgi:hypothetical protein
MKYDLVNDLIMWAKDGDPEAAKMLLKYASESLEEGKAPIDELCKYLAVSLQDIVSGQDANAALNVKKKNTRPSTFNRDIEIAIDYWGKRDEGEKDTVALLKVSQMWGVKESTVKRVKREYKDSAKHDLFFRKRLKDSNPEALNLYNKKREELLLKKKG